MKRIYLAAAVTAFYIVSASEAFSEANSPISLSAAAAICSNHGGWVVNISPGLNGCQFCSRDLHCTTIACGSNGCLMHTNLKPPPPEGGRPGNAAPIISGKPIQEAPITGERPK